ncbi:MAG: hypothetical protein ACREQ5_34675, partial [Candidatus Dormibacteria bacterium]
LTAWAESQFQQMGCTDAGELAITLLAGVEGATVLANAFRDPEIVAGQVRRLERWIDSLAEDCEQQGRGASGG